MAEDVGSQHPAAVDPGEAAAQRERDELYDRLLRLSAEFDNYRKRTDRERREIIETAAADLVRDLLPVIDDFERALAAPGWSDDDAARQGVALIHRQLLDVLRRRGVEPFESVGRDFDPDWHEAVAADPIDGHRDGQVTAELRRGYRMGSRLLRPAQVKVARA
jgi:molecular chaperone GrpE